MSKKSDDLSLKRVVFGSIIGAVISAAMGALGATISSDVGYPAVIGFAIVGALFLPGMVLLSKVIHE